MDTIGMSPIDRNIYYMAIEKQKFTQCIEDNVRYGSLTTTGIVLFKDCLDGNCEITLVKDFIPKFHFYTL